MTLQGDERIYLYVNDPSADGGGFTQGVRVTVGTADHQMEIPSHRMEVISRSQMWFLAPPYVDLCEFIAAEINRTAHEQLQARRAVCSPASASASGNGSIGQHRAGGRRLGRGQGGNGGRGGGVGGVLLRGGVHHVCCAAQCVWERDI